jgi:hypothetical protein
VEFYFAGAQSMIAKNLRVALFLETIFCAVLLLVSSTSVAQETVDAPVDTSFSIQLFKPSPGPLNFFAVESPEIGDDMTPSAGFMMSYQHRPLVLLSCTDDDVCEDNNNAINAIENFLTADIMASFNFLKFFQVGLAIPLTIYQHGEGLVINPYSATAGEEYTSFHLSDIRLHLKARIIGNDRENGPFLAFAAIPSLPMAQWIGSGVSKDISDEGAYGYGGDGTVSATVPKVLFGFRFLNSFRVAINAGATWREKSTILSTETGHTLDYAGAVGYSIVPQVEIMAEIYGNKSLTAQNFADAESAPLAFLGGGRFTIKKDFVI